LLKPIQPFLAASGKFNLIAFGREQALKYIAHYFLVVHNEDAAFLCHQLVPLANLNFDCVNRSLVHLARDCGG
jgi:hypothetical protein